MWSIRSNWWRGRVRRSYQSVLFTIVMTVVTWSAVVVGAADGQSWHEYGFVKDGEFTRVSGLPTYEWLPEGAAPRGLVLAIHGLTLHGGRYELLGKAFASAGYCFVAPDMRGFGRCRTDSNDKVGTADDTIKIIDYDKSYTDIVNIARSMKAKYPQRRLVVIGESLGATMAVRLAAGHPELVDGVILSGPAMRINPRMLFSPSSIWQGLVALLIRPGGVLHLDFFMTKLISSDPGVVQEVSGDPLVRKHLTLSELLRSHKFVCRTRSYARAIRQNMPVLVLQGERDRCVIPYAVVDLSRNIRSNDQMMRWLYNESHLLLETSCVSGATISAMCNWYDDHQPGHLENVKDTEQLIRNLGGHVR